MEPPLDTPGERSAAERRAAGAIGRELRLHAPFTLFGTLTGLALMIVFSQTAVPRTVSSALFWVLHPLHVVLSALVTTGMLRIHGRADRTGWLRLLAVGYAGAIGIATLSDCLIPFAGEWLLDLPRRAVHVGLVERPWLVNSMAFLGIGLGAWRPHTRLPHAGHVLLSTCATLFHMQLALDGAVQPLQIVGIGLFLFLAVWVPCCTSDIAFPLLFAPRRACRAPRADPGLRPSAGGGGPRRPGRDLTPARFR